MMRILTLIGYVLHGGAEGHAAVRYEIVDLRRNGPHR